MSLSTGRELGDRRIMPRFLSFLLLAAIAHGAACSPNKNDNTGGPPPSSCEGAMTHLCQQVGTCNPPSCKWTRGGGDGGTGGTLGGFSKVQDCIDYFIANECKSGGTAGFDYAGCSSAVDSAACVDSAIGKVLRYPTACPSPP
jgi:hypothetical protein